MAAGADRILDGAELFDTLEAAIADCTFVFAATARAHDQAKPVVGAPDAAALMAPRIAAGETVRRRLRPRAQRARERRSRARRPHPDLAHQSGFRLAQSGAGRGDRRLRMVQIGNRRQAAVRHAGEIGARAPKEQLLAFFAVARTRAGEAVEFFRPPDKRDTMQINLRNIFTRMQPTQQDIQTLHGVIMSIAEGRKGPAARRRARRRGGRTASRASRRAWRRPGAEGARSGAWALARCCAAIRPRPSAYCGRRWSMTAVSPAVASSGRPRSGNTSAILCRFRCV